MGIILDIVLIAIIALNVFICYKKGLVKLAEEEQEALKMAKESTGSNPAK